MRNRVYLLILISLIIFFSVSIGACKRATTTETPLLTGVPSQAGEAGEKTAVGTSSQTVQSTAQITVTPLPEQPYPPPTSPITLSETGLPYPQPSTPAPVSTTTPTFTITPLQLATSTEPAPQIPQPSLTQTPTSPAPTETASLTPPYPGPEITSTSPAYPGPEITNTSPAYPGPEATNTPLPSPGSATFTPQATQTPVKPVTSTATPGVILFPSPTAIRGTGTPGPTPTELPPRPPLSPPPAGSSVTIWHSWARAEADMLQSIIQSFKRLYPDVTFNLLYVPLDDLFNTYHAAVFQGKGPSLLLGPSEWGSELYDEKLITDLNPFVPPNYLVNINPAALASGKYRDALISLPISQHGLVMFRNTSIISTPPASIDELITLSLQATHGGIVGSYFERGSYFSVPAIIGLGGRLMDEDENPTFNDAFGLDWFGLLTAYDEAGAVTFNTNRDLDMFKRGRVGIIIDGTWNISVLSQSIGAENLAIDPWPTYADGHMSGWVETDSVFLNANIIGNDRFAALSFLGYLLDSNVQMRLAEVGHIPAVFTTQPRDPLIQQAMIAFTEGVPYPNNADNDVLKVYWSELDMAIRNVFERGVDAGSALKVASDNIYQILRDMRTAP